MSEQDESRPAVETDDSPRDSAARSGEESRADRDEPVSAAGPESSPPGDAVREPGSPPVSVYRRATWELELLISAALVFSLFQLPGRLTGFWSAVQPTLSPDIMLLPFMVFYMAMLSTYALTIAFTAHFVLRSFWVGVCGLRAAFPRGIDWQRYDGSQWAKRIGRRHTMTLDDLESLTDRTASGIFAALFAVLLMLLTVFGYTAVVLLTATLLAQWVFPGLNMLVIFYSAIALFLLPAMYLGWMERSLKKHPEREAAWPRRVAMAERIQRIASSSSVGKLYQPILMTFATNLSSKATTRASMVSIVVLVGIFLSTLLLSTGILGFDSYSYFPSRSGERSVRPNHYDDQLPTEVRERLPLIQSKVIEAPYLELFVPYHVSRDRRSLERVCPQLEPPRSEGFFVRRAGSGDEAAHREALRCLDRIYEVSLDGSILRSGDWVFYRHPERDLEGVLRMIDVRGLRPGRHTLVLERLAIDEDGEAKELEQEDGESDEEFARRSGRRRYVIPFWV